MSGAAITDFSQLEGGARIPAVHSQLEAQNPTGFHPGDNNFISTNTAISYTPVTYPAPVMTQSQTTTQFSVQTKRGPHIWIHSEILLQRQEQCENNCYNLLGF